MPHLFPSFPYIEDCSKRIRVYVDGVCIIDTKKAKLVWLHPYYPTYYFSDLKFDSPDITVSPPEADDANNCLKYSIHVRQAKPRTLTLHTTGKLANLSTIKFSTMDTWFEEEEQIFIHPKDPYKRIDILQSSRQVRVEVKGVVLAESSSPRLLFETGLPVRIYIPKTDCRMDLWVPSDSTSECPYKGEAHYYDVLLPSGEKVKDIIWWYPNTTLECAPIRGFVAFYDEKVDVWVDGEKQERPVTHFS
ncbi:DUF427-domain-containing protein [Phlegmacium glaucopus]|nr:DUF427-domain-containing protein [Phlegmacium glaucopus]